MAAGAGAESPDVSPSGAAASLTSAAGGGGVHAARLGDRDRREVLRGNQGQLSMCRLLDIDTDHRYFWKMASATSSYHRKRLRNFLINTRRWTHLRSCWMDSDKIVKVRLGCSHLQSNAEALGDLASVGTKVVEPDNFLLQNKIFKAVSYIHRIILCPTF